MSVFFLNPLYLIALIGASVPLLIHLLNRRRLKRVRFPAVRFILLSQRRIARRYRLRHWLLLALRTAAVVLLALLLAHPLLQIGAGLFASGGPLSAVLIFDNSLSMSWADEREGFKHAKEIARLILSSSKDGDRIALLPTNAPVPGPAVFRQEKTALLQALDAVEVSAESADFARALRTAYELLQGTATEKEIWIVTDLALTGWDQFNLSKLQQYNPRIPVKIVHPGERAGPLNATVKEITGPTEGLAMGMPIRIAARVANFSDKEIRDLAVQLSLNGRERERHLVTVPPRGESEVAFQLSLERPGSHHGQLQLKKDGLAGNATANFTLHARDKLKVLLVDGDPKTALVQSETFFLSRALNPSGDPQASLFLPTVTIPGALASMALEPYPVLIFCNLPALPDPLLPRLQEHLRRGGGVLIFLGDRVQAEDYNRKLFQASPPILPGRIATLREKAEEKVQDWNREHPALAPLADPLLSSAFKSAKFSSYFRLDADGPARLLTLGNGDALLTEKKLGSGRVLLFASAADRDWSDFPFKAAYLPLIQSLVRYLASGESGRFDPGLTAGEAKMMSVPAVWVGKSVRIVKPDGKEREVRVVGDGEKAKVSFAENDLAGIYKVGLPAPSDLAQSYAVNPPYLESRLERIGREELERKLDPIRVELIPESALAQRGKRVDLAYPLLGLLLVTLAGEGWLAQRSYE